MKKIIPIKQIKKTATWFSCLCFLTILSGCAQHSLKAPCPNYGAWCTKTPVNSWQ